jgi:capsid protein
MPETRRRSTLAAILDVFANRAEARQLARRTVEKHQGLQAQGGYPYGGYPYGGFPYGGSFPGIGGARSSGAKYPGGMSKPFGGHLWNHFQTRQQARDIVEDSIHAYAMVHRRADTIVDQALRVQSTPDALTLGLSPEETDAIAQKMDSLFDAWCGSKDQHRSGQFCFYEATHLLGIEDSRDNDEFIRYFYSQRSDLLNPLQYEIIDANQIRGDAFTATTSISQRTIDGIERDAAGNEVSYHVWVQDAGNPPPPPRDVLIPKYGEKSGRLMMTHGFRAEYAGQQRGYSLLGVSAQEWQELENYILSIIIKARNQSQLVGAVQNTQQPSSNPFENTAAPPYAGPSGMDSTVLPGATVNATLDPAGGINFTPIAEAAFDNPGATLITQLAQGDEIKLLQNTAPGPEFADFVDSYLEGILPAYGMSLELFKIKFESSYSAARAGLAVIWRKVEMDRTFLDRNFIAPTREMVIACEIAAGRLSLPGFNDPRLRSAWLRHRVIGTPPIQVDPTKELAADEGYLALHATTPDDIAYHHNGSSFRDNLARNRVAFKDWVASPITTMKAPAGALAEVGTEPPAPKSKQPARSR